MKLSIYNKELGTALILYGIILVASIYAIKSQIVSGLARDAVVIIPMAPASLVARAVIRELRRIDELQRQIQLEALGISFMVTAILSFSYGFLEAGAGFPSITMFAVWPTMAMAWIVSLHFVRRRYEA